MVIFPGGDCCRFILDHGLLESKAQGKTSRSREMTVAGLPSELTTKLSVVDFAKWASQMDFSPVIHQEQQRFLEGRNTFMAGFTRLYYFSLYGTC